MNRQPPRWQFQTISLNSRNLSGLRHKYDDVRCAQFGLWRGARRAHPRPGAVTDEQRSHRPNSAQPGGQQVFFAQTLLLAPHRSTAGYARRSRLVWAKNPLPRTSSYLCLRPLSSAGRGNGRGAMPFFMSFAMEPEIVTLAWIDNASVNLKPETANLKLQTRCSALLNRHHLQSDRTGVLALRADHPVVGQLLQHVSSPAGR